MLILKQQVQDLDCGPCVIQLMYKHYYGDWISISTIKSKTNFNSKGINIIELIKLGKEFGLILKSFKGNLDNLKEINIKTPIISIINSDDVFHYIIIEKITSKNIIYIDPVFGKRKEDWYNFDTKYLGIILLVNKDSGNNKVKPITKNDLLKINNKKDVLITSVISLFLITLSFIGSFYLKTILDKVLPNHEVIELLYLTLGFLIITIIRVVFNWINNIIFNNIQNKNVIELLNLYIDKMKNVSFNKIIHFNTSMHLRNLEFINSISIFKTKYITTIISQMFCLIASTLILIWLNIYVFLLALVSTCISLLVMYLYRKIFKKLDKEKIQINLKTQNNFLSILSGIEYFKIEETNNTLLSNWQENIIENYELNFKHNLIETIYGLIQTLIQSIIPFIITILSIQKIWLNQLTIGQMMIFMSIFNFFSSPFEIFCSMLLEYPIINQHADNLYSFFILEEENKNSNGIKIDKINSILLENISFSFNDGNDLLKIKKLFLNKKYILTGKNGVGKTTFSKIVSTLLKPSGNIYFNGKLLEFCNLSSIRNQICYVSSYNDLPNTTIYDFLINKKDSNRDYLLNNIEKYNLLNIFNSINLKLSTEIHKGGKNLSSGQKQFISLMKIFSKNPSLVILDEAFENLDLHISNILKKIVKKHLKNSIVIEISHNKNYLFYEKEINCEEFK